MGKEKAGRKTMPTLVPFFFEAVFSSSLMRAREEHNSPGTRALLDEFLHVVQGACSRACPIPCLLAIYYCHFGC
jgi:hypothetical protein